MNGQFFRECLAGAPRRSTGSALIYQVLRMSPGKRRRINEYLSFRAAVTTDAGTAAAAKLTRVRCGLPVIRPESGSLGSAVFVECSVSALAILQQLRRSAQHPA